MLIVPYPNGWNDSEDARKEIAEKVYYLAREISGIRFESPGAILDLETPLSNPTRLISDVQHLILSVSKSLDRVEHTIVDENIGQIRFSDDPYTFLYESGQVIPTSPGVFVYQGLFERLLSGLDSEAEEYARTLGALPQRVPTTVPTVNLIRCGYTKSFPQHLMFAGALHHDMDSLTAIAKRPEVYIEHPEELDSIVGNHNQILAPTVCHHCFSALSNTAKIPAAGLLLTALGTCHRHEGRNFGGLHRLQTYLMREIVFLGESKFVVSSQEDILEAYKNLYRKWNLTWRVVVASDPFFATGDESRKVFQTMFRLKYEMQMHVPHSDSWVSVASFNNHQRSLVEPFDIGFEDSDEEIHSGCVGWGFERIAYAILCQKGFDTDNWPVALLRDLGLD